MYSRTFCGHLNVLYIFDPTCTKYRFEVRLELYGANAAPPYSSLTPRRHRQADGQLSSLYPPSSFTSFGAACVKISCLPPSLVRLKTRLCCLVFDKYRTCIIVVFP